MKLLTHCLAGAFIIKLIGLGDMASLVFCLIGCVLPDIDFKLGLKHRCYTHSVLFILPCFLVMPLGVGVLSHIVLDLLTPTGCKLLFPKNDWFILFGAPLKTGVHDSFICTITLGGFYLL